MKNYFKKFSIMFAMLLAVIGVGLIQNGTIADAAIVEYVRGVQYLNPIEGYTRYDDTNENITYSDNFVDYSTTIQNNSELLYNGNRKELWPGKGAGTIKFSFYGTSIALIDYVFNDRAKNCTISFDGGKTTEEFSANGNVSNNKYNKTAFYVKNGLENKRHDVVINIPASSTTWFCIDAIDINGYLVYTNESIDVDKSSIDLIVEDTEKLKATTTPAGLAVVWASSDELVATVDQDGNVTAVGEGTCTITATINDGSNLSDSCIVNVKKKDTDEPNPEPTESEYIVNTALAKGNNTNNASGSVTIIFHGTADTTLSVVKTADVKEVWVGDNFTYTIVVTNTGSKTAKDVVISDSAPNHIEFNVDGITTTQGVVDSSTTSSNLKVNVGDIPAGGTVTVKIPVTVV